MANKIGNLIKKARTDANLTQDQLARKIKNVSSADISKAERGELKLSQEVLKQIAKATGVTQKSLLDAAASSSYKSTSSSSAAAKTTAKTGTKTTAKTTAKTASGSKTSSSGTSMKLSSTEKKLVELYREADTSTKKKVMELLKTGDISMGGVIGDALEGLLGGAIDMFTKK